MKAPTAVHTPGTATISSSNATVGAVADMESTNTTTVTGNLNNGNKNKNTSPTTNIPSWQQEMLMERLRTKCPILRPLQDSTKALRNCILNKQHLMDCTDRNTLSTCLDNLQQNIPVTSLDAMIERLEATARQLGLNFTSSPSAVYEVYVSCDMFYVEVLLERDGTTRDVKVEFGGESTTSTDNVELSQSCPELIDCLSRCDFKQFTAHLEGFLAMYTLNTEDKKAKLRTQYALKALETDLTKLFELAQETISDTYKLVLKSPVGLLFPRRGGQSMRLVYFISPYELLDVGTGLAVPLTPTTALNKEFSHNVQLRITATTALHKLQLTTLMQVTKAADGNKLPSFSGLTASNSITIPSVFTLKLANPLPLSLTLALRIADVTGIPLKDVTGADVNEAAATATGTSYSQLMDLIVHQAGQGQLSGSSSDKGLFVTLPDQQHCYFMPTQGCDFPGMLVSSIPFTHPTHITSVLMLLRAQAAFNTLVGSCVRPNSKQDMESAYMFEVTSLSHEYISVTFEHPLDESTATAELDLSDLCNVRCRLHTLPQDASVTFCSDEYATKVLQRCMSIPVTMRALMRKVIREDLNDALSQGESVVMSNASSDLNQNTSKFLLSDYERLGPAAAGRREHMPGGGGSTGGIGAGLSGAVGGGTPTAVTTASGSTTLAAASSVAGACGITAVGGGGRSPSLTVAHGVGNATPCVAGPSNNQQQTSSSFFSKAAFAQIKAEPGIDVSGYAGIAAANQKMTLPLQQQPHQQHFLEEAKTVKVRKRKVMEIDRKGGGGGGNISTSNSSPYSDDIIEVEDPLKDPLDISDTKRDVERLLTYDSLESSRRRMDKPPPSYEASTEAKHRREAKMEKLQTFLAKRRASNDFSATTTTSSSASSSDASSCDLAALREKVYGAGSAATFAQFNLVPSDDNITADGRDITKKSKKARIATTSDHSSDATRKSPIVLDLTESETPTSSSSKKSSSSSSSSSRSSGCSSLSSGERSSIASSLNASVLLKRPGIEIFPIAGGNAPISIPSSITVTPVIKSSSSSSLSYSSEDKYKDRKERKDKKESSRDKKRRREDSPSSVSSSSKSKVHIISSSLKHSSSMPSMDKLKSESSKSSSSSSSLSGITIKPSTPPYQSPSKSSSSNRPPSSPNLSKSSSLHSKLSYSPTNKTSSSNSSASKSIYSPSQSQHSSSSSPKGTNSPKLSSSPKYSGLSPKHTSSGKPSINALKSSAPSLSSFSKTSLSPKLSSSTSKSSSGNSSGSTTNSHQYTSSRDKMSSSLPARAQSTSSSSSVGSSFSLGSSLSSSSSSKSKVSSSSGSSSSSSEKTKSTNSSSSDALSISKVSQSGGESSASLNPFFSVGNTTVASALQDKSSFLLDKGKASPPKNRKGSCLSDIVDKLRAGVAGSSDSACLVEPSDKKDVTKVGGITDLKKDPDKKTDYTIKPLDGLKLSINKSKSKELKENLVKNSSNCNSLSPTPKSSKSSSGLKPGVLSGPASKKVSMSSLPPIPKLSSASVNTASVSPLSSGQLSYSSSTSSSYNSTSLTGSSSSHSGYSNSSSSYQKERSKDKTSSSSNSSSGERSKGKESSNSSSSSSKSSSSEIKKESSLNIPEKHFSSSSSGGNSSSSSISSSSTLSNSSNSKSRDESRSSGGSTQSSSSSGFNRKQASGDGENRSNKSSSSSHQRIPSDKTDKAQSNDSLPSKAASDSKAFSYAMRPPSSVQAPGQYHGKRAGDGSSITAGGPDLGHKHNKPPSESSKEAKLTGDGSSAVGNSSSQSGLKNHTVVPSSLKSSSVSNDLRTTSTSITTASISKESHGNSSRKGDVFRLGGTDYNHVSSNSTVPVTNSISNSNASSKASPVSSGATNSVNSQGSVTSASDPGTASTTSSAGKSHSLTTSGSCKVSGGDGVISPVASIQMPSCVSLPPPPAPPPVSAPSLPSTGYGHPLSPSVSIKIVKSPAPVSSPLSMISPLSVSSQHSPCIIDDDLMDEALMGPRK